MRKAALAAGAARAVRVYTVPQVATDFVMFNSRRGPLADEGLRRRLFESVDVPALTRRLFDGARTAAWGIIPAGLLGHEPWPESARRTSVPADLPSLGITCQAVSSRYGRVASALREMLRPSVEVTIVSDDASSDNFGRIRQGSVDMYVGGWICDYPDPDGMLSTSFHSKRGQMGGMLGSDEVDRLIERGRREPEARIRHEIYRELEAVLRRRALVLPLWQETRLVVFDARVEGVETNPFSPMIPREKLSIRDPERR
jgi:ABC-type oligopeptide transport system substrate-binding subunit